MVHRVTHASELRGCCFWPAYGFKGGEDAAPPEGERHASSRGVEEGARGQHGSGRALPREGGRALRSHEGEEVEHIVLPPAPRRKGHCVLWNILYTEQYIYTEY